MPGRTLFTVLENTAAQYGDAIALYADPSRAKKILGWEAKYKDPEAIIRSAWNWFSKHPKGYHS